MSGARFGYSFDGETFQGVYGSHAAAVKGAHDSGYAGDYEMVYTARYKAKRELTDYELEVMDEEGWSYCVDEEVHEHRLEREP